MFRPWVQLNIFFASNLHLLYCREVLILFKCVNVACMVRLFEMVKNALSLHNSKEIEGICTSLGFLLFLVWLSCRVLSSLPPVCRTTFSSQWRPASPMPLRPSLTWSCLRREPHVLSRVAPTHQLPRRMTRLQLIRRHLRIHHRTTR